MSGAAFGPDFGGGKLPSPRRAARDRLPLALYLAVQRIADRELGTLLSQAASEAERVVLAHAGQNIGAKVRRAQLALVMAELRAEQVRLWSKDGPISDALRRQMEEAAAAAAKAHNLLTRVLWNEADGVPPGLESGLVQTARRGIQSIISRTQFRHGLSEQVYRTGRATQARIGRMVDQALGRGASWRELAQDVKRFIDPRTPGGVSYAAKRLARTEINNAFHTTQVRIAVESPFVVGMQWHLSGAHPVPDECNDFDGEVFEPEKVPPKPHPQCLCFMTPGTVSRDEFVDKFEAGEYDEYIRSVQAGYSAPVPTPKPAAEKKPEPASPKPAAETDDQIIDRVMADPSSQPGDLFIVSRLLKGETRQRVAADHQVSVEFITNFIKKHNLPYRERVKFKTPSVTGKIHQKHRDDIQGSLDEFVKEFPEVTTSLGGVRVIGDDPVVERHQNNDDTYAYYTPGDPNVYLNEKYFVDLAPWELSLKAHGDADIGWHPKNCQHSNSIFEHEFGHHLDFSLSALDRQELFVMLANELNGVSFTAEQFKEQWNQASKLLKQPLPFTGWMFNVWLESHANTRVSRYAGTNSFEFIAELFASSRQLEPSHLAKLVAKFFADRHGPNSIPGGARGNA